MPTRKTKEEALAWLERAALSVSISQRVFQEEPALRAILSRAADAGLPADHHVGPEAGKVLELLARLAGARRAVEVGTLAGYSAWWIAQALPRGGRLDTVEHDAARSAVARRGLRDAGLAGKVAVRRAEAAAALKALAKRGPYDFAFFDADKPSYPRFLKWCVECLRPGGVAVFDDADAYCLPALASGERPRKDRLYIDAGVKRELFDLLSDRRLFSFFTIVPVHTGLIVAIRAR